MSEQRDAWVELPTEQEMRDRGASGNPYDFGFIPAMARLQGAHPRIGPAFGKLFREVMFVDGALDRSERELIATVAASAQDCFY